MELLLVVGIDEPQLAVDDSISRLTCQLFEALDGHPGLLDGQQLLYQRRRCAAGAKQFCIQHIGQQVDERQLRRHADTYLLMTAKRIVPGWEAEEHDAAKAQETADMEKEGILSQRWYVLYHVVYQYQVVPTGFFARSREGQEVLADKLSLLARLLEELPGLLNAAPVDVDALHVAALLGEGKQVAPSPQPISKTRVEVFTVRKRPT